MWGLIWSWFFNHWAQVMQGVAQTKTFADTVDSVKRLAPPKKLESKDAAQQYLEQTADILDDKNKGGLPLKCWRKEGQAQQSKAP
jgi:hypothetical protein